MRAGDTRKTVRQVTVLCALFAVISSTSYAADAVDLDTGLLRDAFEAADTSGDGRVDEGEFAADAVAAFVTVDRDGDDRVSVEELRVVGVASIGSLDVDGDDHLTIIEVMNAKLAEFESVDTNGDGELTIEEVAEFERVR